MAQRERLGHLKVCVQAARDKCDSDESFVERWKSFIRLLLEVVLVGHLLLFLCI